MATSAASAQSERRRGDDHTEAYGRAPSVQPPSTTQKPDRTPDRRRRRATIVAGTGLTGIAAIHALWASGSPWPAASRDELADLIVGSRPFPSSAMTVGVVIIIGIGTGTVLVESRRMTRADTTSTANSAPPGIAGRAIRLGALFVPAAMALRGVVGFAMSGLELGQEPDLYRRWDLRIYSPLCLALAIVAYLAVRRTPESEPPARNV